MNKLEKLFKDCTAISKTIYELVYERKTEKDYE